MTKPTQYEKRDILEVVQEIVPTLSLEYKSGDRPYYIGRCPLHDDHNPSFAIYPETQKWICFACSPEYRDVIDFVRMATNVSFVEARDIACHEQTPVTALQTHVMKMLVQKPRLTPESMVLYAKRVNNILRADPTLMPQLIQQVHKCVESDTPLALDRALRTYELELL